MKSKAKTNSQNAIPKTFSTFFNIPKEKLIELGVFDPILNFDTKLFVDPLLLQKSSSPIIKNSYQTYEKFFEGILVLLRTSKMPGDKCWNTAKKLVRFPEYKETCIGYGNNSTNGSGMGVELSDQVFEGAIEIISLSKDEPAIFLLLPLLEEGIGGDRISDMTQNIIDEDICKYTLDVMNTLKLEGNFTYISKNGKKYNLLQNPFSASPIKLVPLDILADLPVADDVGSFIYEISSFNSNLREMVSKTIGKIWDIKVRKSDAKRVLAKELKNNKEFFLEVLETLKNEGYKLTPYDLETDPKGLYRWLADSDAFTNIEFAKEVRFCDDNLEALSQVVRALILHFQTIIETQDISQMFWARFNDQPRHVREFYSQMLFFVVCNSWITGQDSNIKLIKNDNSLQFTISSKNHLIVHIKHNNNNNLEEGYSKIIKNSDKNNQNIYVILNFKDKDSDQLKIIKKFQNPLCPIIEIDVAYQENPDNTVVEYEDVNSAINKHYLTEKSKGGTSSYQAYKPLKEKVEEVCGLAITKKKHSSARQLCQIVAKQIEENHLDLLKNFTPYQNQTTGNDWTQPTFYNWCNQIFKKHKS